MDCLVTLVGTSLVSVTVVVTGAGCFGVAVTVVVLVSRTVVAIGVGCFAAAVTVTVLVMGAGAGALTVVVFQTVVGTEIVSLVSGFGAGVLADGRLSDFTERLSCTTP